MTARSLRHFHGGVALQAGQNIVVVSKRLGYSNVSITSDIYAHSLPGRNRQVSEAFAAAIDGGDKQKKGVSRLSQYRDTQLYVARITVTMSNGVVNTHAIPLGIVGSTSVKTALDHYIAYLEKSGVARWRDKIPSSVFVLSNPNVMYNGSYVVSMSIRTDTENPSGELFSDPEDIVSEEQPVAKLRREIGFLADRGS